MAGGGGNNLSNNGAKRSPPPSSDNNRNPPPGNPPPPADVPDEDPALKCESSIEDLIVRSAGRFPKQLPNYICEFCQSYARLHHHGTMCTSTVDQVKLKTCDMIATEAALARAMRCCVDCSLLRIILPSFSFQHCPIY